MRLVPNFPLSFYDFKEKSIVYVEVLESQAEQNVIFYKKNY